MGDKPLPLRFPARWGFTYYISYLSYTQLVFTSQEVRGILFFFFAFRVPAADDVHPTPSGRRTLTFILKKEMYSLRCDLASVLVQGGAVWYAPNENEAVD